MVAKVGGGEAEREVDVGYFVGGGEVESGCEHVRGVFAEMT